MHNRDYWRRRFVAIEKVVVQSAEEYYDKLEQEYRKAMKSIEQNITTWYQRFANNNEIDMAEAKRLLNTNELKEFRWTVEDYIKHGGIPEEWQKELENASARVHISRLESLEIQLQQELERLYGNQLDDVDTMVRRIYQDTYYHSAFEIQRGFGVGWNLQRFNEKQLQHVIDTPWTLDKKTFSDRIWKRKDELLRTTRTGLSQMIIRGDPPDKAIRMLAKRLDVDRYKAGRLVMTESAYFASAAQKQCFEELDVERYELVATLDAHTSETCQALDGQVYEMAKYEVGVTAPPFHPWCRTTTVPYFEDNVGERAARGENGKTYYVPSSMTYSTWEDRFVNKEDNSKESATDFKKSLITAKNTIAESVRWRVDSGHSLEDYVQDKLIVTEGGSTLAITPVNDIISVCRSENDTLRGKDLMELAVRNGGTKLDSYDGNYGFYRKCGFEPVSWTKFDKQYAPEGWVEGRDREEDIIFFKYTGDKVLLSRSEFEEEMQKFKDTVEAKEYDVAMKERDEKL